MTDENILIHLSEENKKRQLFLKKIKLTDFPILKNIYNDFFNNKANYFKNKYKNNYLSLQILVPHSHRSNFLRMKDINIWSWKQNKKIIYLKKVPEI